MRLEARKSDPPDYSVAGESPLGTCHRGGTFDGHDSRTRVKAKQKSRRVGLPALSLLRRYGFQARALIFPMPPVP